MIYDWWFLKWEVPEGVPFSSLLLAQNVQDGVALPPKNNEEGLNRRAQRKQRINGLPWSPGKSLRSDCRLPLLGVDDSNSVPSVSSCSISSPNSGLAQRLKRSSKADGLLIGFVILRNSQIINRKSSINPVRFSERAGHEAAPFFGAPSDMHDEIGGDSLQPGINRCQWAGRHPIESAPTGQPIPARGRATRRPGTWDRPSPEPCRGDLKRRQKRLWSRP